MTPALDLETDLDNFLRELCEEWEFCGPLTANALLKAHPTLHSHVFARAVLEAAGMNPERESGWTRRLKRRFAQRYRDDGISAARFADE
jgi:hypothetical protein